EGQLQPGNWLIDPGGNTPAQRAAENRQTRTGLIDTHPHYPHQLVTTPKLSLAQAGLGALALAVAAALAVRRKGSPLLPLLAVAGGCWLLTFTISAPLWAHLPGLALLQLPYRLLGPLGVTLAVAGAGALAIITQAVERRWRPRGRVLGWAMAALLGGGVLFNSLGDRTFPLAAAPRR